MQSVLIIMIIQNDLFVTLQITELDPSNTKVLILQFCYSFYYGLSNFKFLVTGRYFNLSEILIIIVVELNILIQFIWIVHTEGGHLYDYRTIMIIIQDLVIIFTYTIFQIIEKNATKEETPVNYTRANVTQNDTSEKREDHEKQLEIISELSPGQILITNLSTENNVTLHKDLNIKKHLKGSKVDKDKIGMKNNSS